MTNYSPVHVALLFAVAFAAGVINSVAGGGTLLTFPLLLALGLDPKIANATSTVALWPALAGGLFGYRREMAGTRDLLCPFLILSATILFMLQEPINRWVRIGELKPDEARRRRWWAGAIFFQFCSAIYGGYFGAGNGILMLAAMGLMGMTDIHRANGLKNFLGLMLNFVAILLFAAYGMVHWGVALVMAVGAVGGGYFGASAARYLGRAVVRRAVVAIGFIIGAYMLWRTFAG
ncbi:MAG: sulfite exporter TauE/SafE family protein [Acidobacteria bacterium]|nr:sulfite exporter TauE/SafE family protein [Acidobacteriota bacterium]